MITAVCEAKVIDADPQANVTTILDTDTTTDSGLNDLMAPRPVQLDPRGHALTSSLLLVPTALTWASQESSSTDVAPTKSINVAGLKLSTTTTAPRFAVSYP